MYLIFDTETTGLPKNWKAPITDSDNWPRCVQLAWQVHDEMGELIEVKNFIIKPEGYDIPFNASKIHGITTERAIKQGVALDFVLEEFNKSLSECKFVVGHNITFDNNIMGAEFYRKSIDTPLMEMKALDSCTELTASYCQIPGGRGGKFKLPKLEELHQHLFNEGFAEAHNASADVEATTRCFLELIRKEIYSPKDLDVSPDYFAKFKEHNPNPFKLIGLNIEPYSETELEEDDTEVQKEVGLSRQELKANKTELEGVPFTHLHNHSQFSILQSTSDIKSLVAAAVNNNMPGVALTDSANMMGAFHFVKVVSAHNKSVEKENQEGLEDIHYVPKKKLKPIIGCEFFVCEDHLDKTKKDNGYQVVLLAKNKNGYQNIAKLSSIANIDGFYYVPRVDKNLIAKYKEDIIVLTGGINGEVPGLILNVGEKQGEEALLWWKKEFKDDFYIELVRHGIGEEEIHVNKILVDLAEKHKVKLVAANNTFYINQDNAEAHDILLCVRDGERKSTPIGRGRGFRFGMANDQFYFKSTDEMKKLFQDIPEAIINTQEIVNKVEPFELARNVLLPKFDFPDEFKDPLDEKDGGNRGENNYLRHLTLLGATKRYGEELTKEQQERIDFELSVIKNTGYPGYFLIVQDFIQAARDMGVSVGPGRGSAAGSVVAYCLKITNIDPLLYGLLFERFLNPDRVSMPDIDIDFDDEGRGRVIDWVINKYGSQQVAQIITYGTMAAKSSIRDTARALDLPLQDASRLANLIPGIKLNKLFNMDEKALAKKLRADELEMALELKRIAKTNTPEAEVIKQALILEGSVRNTGTHACGVIITPDDITKFVPVATAKDSDMYVTQFDNSVVEDAGLLKMDFLGLKTLTLIKDTCKLIKHIHNVDLDPEEFSLTDELTYELFQRGETVGIFQYESPGMQKYMKELKPTVFADLIAMNALYRPGPIAYIPSFIKRKHGDEEIVYDIEDAKEHLEETYGITVYQEQVMLLSQSLAGFTKGEADVLRKAMGKKIFSLLAELKPKFVEGGKERGHDEKALNKIWKDWEAFAEYAFNKSHSTCYAWIAYQTAYLKAHYPAEYMAAVLSNNMNDIKSVTFFMDECKRMGMDVLGPDVNESFYKFTVNKEGAIRFGMGAIKGVGEGAVETIVNNRKDAKYKTVFDMASKIDLRAANKRALENLVYAGAFDSFEGHRAQYVEKDSSGRMAIETAIKYGNAVQENTNSLQQSLFGGEGNEVSIPEPQLPKAEEWGTILTLNKEKEVVGVYISGHPLDDFKFEIDNFCVGNVSVLNNMDKFIGRDLSLAGIITSAEHRIAKNGNPFGIFEFEDYQDSYRQLIFKEDYLKHKHYLVPGNFLFMKGKIATKRWGNMAPEFKIQSIELLTEVKDKLSKSLTLTIPIKTVTKTFVDNLLQTLVPDIEEKKGTCRLKLVVSDEAKTKVSFFSRTINLNITKELIQDLEEMEGVEYKVN